MKQKVKDTIKMDISNLNSENINKTKSFIQADAFMDIKNILIKDLENKIDPKADIYKIRVHNTIFLNGDRGSGKTQFLLGIKSYLKKDKNIKGLYFFNPIDPTLLHDNESFLTIIIAKILNNLEHQNKFSNNNGKQKVFYKNLNNLAQAIDGIINNTYDKRSSLENIAQDQTSLKLEEYMHSFLKLVAKMLGKKRLILLIDDVDMAFDKGFEVLEVLRKYLSSPYIIPIVTGDLNLYKIIVENNFLSKIDKKLKDKYQENNKRLTIDYLVKVLPTHRRVYIKSIYELASTKKIIFIYDKNNKYIFTRIPDDTSRYFSNNRKENHDNFFFYSLAYNIYKAEESAKVFVKNLFSNPLRNILQFLHHEYNSHDNTFFLTSEANVEIIENRYHLLLTDNVESETTYLKEAKKYFNQNDWDNAVKFCNKSLEQKETEEAYYLLGNSQYNLYLWEEAERAYKKVLELNKNNADAYLKIGDTHRKRKKYDEAIQYYKQSLNLNPNNDDTYNKLGICYLHLTNQTNIDKAVKHFKKSIECNNNNPKPYINIIETSFIFNKKYYDNTFEKEFENKFHDVQNIMKYYEMFKILTKIKEKEESSIIEKMLDDWIDRYKSVHHPDWSFYEIELSIKNEKNKEIQNNLIKYLKIFKEYA